MQPLNIHIRGEHPGDYDAILRLTYAAFLTLDYPGRRRMDEHYLIQLLQESDALIPELCFVAEHAGAIVGHILYTKSGFTRPDGSKAETVTFGPLSVLPAVHRRGVGAALVGYSLEKARTLGHKAVLITGVPAYYPKLGFQRGRDFALTMADGSAPDAFMAYALKPGYLEGGGVFDSWAPEFEKAENDDAGYAAFHERFLADFCRLSGN